MIINILLRVNTYFTAWNFKQFGQNLVPEKPNAFWDTRDLYECFSTKIKIWQVPTHYINFQNYFFRTQKMAKFWSKNWFFVIKECSYIANNHFIGLLTLENMGLDTKSVQKAPLRAEISNFSNVRKILLSLHIGGTAQITKFVNYS